MWCHSIYLTVTYNDQVPYTGDLSQGHQVNTPPLTNRLALWVSIHSETSEGSALTGSAVQITSVLALMGGQTFAGGRRMEKKDFSFSSASLMPFEFADSSQIPQLCESDHEGIPPELPAQLWDPAWPGKWPGSGDWAMDGVRAAGAKVPGTTALCLVGVPGIRRRWMLVRLYPRGVRLGFECLLTKGLSDPN